MTITRKGIWLFGISWVVLFLLAIMNAAQNVANLHDDEPKTVTRVVTMHEPVVKKVYVPTMTQECKDLVESTARIARINLNLSGYGDLLNSALTDSRAAMAAQDVDKVNAAQEDVRKLLKSIQTNRSDLFYELDNANKIKSKCEVQK
jgi:pyridoxal/pyridoxine/pyridoxamine kinase